MATPLVSPGQVRRLLVMKFRSPGDVLLMTPALAALKRGFPRASISVAVNAECAPLIELHPAVSEVLPYKRSSRPRSFLARAAFELAYARRLRARRFDVAVNATEGDRGAWLALASGAAVRVGLAQEGSGARLLKHRLFHRLLPPWPLSRHNVLANLDLVALLGVEVSEHRVELALSEADRAGVEAELRSAGVAAGEPLVHLHAPTRPYKSWTQRAWAAVIDHLELERGVRVALSGAPAERDHVAGITGLCRARPANLAGRLGLRQVGALSERAVLFLGADTVAMHMAAAVNTPVVALFGPSIAATFGPWDNAGGEEQYPARHGVQRSGPHTVIQPDWDCVPCGNMGGQGSGKSRCLEELRPEQVIPVLDEALSRALAARG